MLPIGRVYRSLLLHNCKSHVSEFYPFHFSLCIIHVKSDSPTPSNLTATYKSPSTVLLEWMFSDPVVGDTMYTVYYQSGGVSYNTSFTLTEDQRSYLMMVLPLEVITNIFYSGSN